MRHRARHRWGSTVVVTAAFALAVGSQGAAVALPEKAPAVDREFASSFEADDPAPDWLNTVDTTAGGGKRASGVDGGYSSGIPGNVTDHVTDVRASSENTGGGEVKENLVDGESSTKWLTFAPTGWAEFDLDKPVKLVTYALTSANDFAERDPKDWTSGFHGRQGLEDRRHPRRRVLPRAVQDQDVRPRRTGRVPALPARGHQEQRRLRHPPARRRPVLHGRRRQPGPAGHAVAGRPRPERLPDREGGAGFTGKKALRYAGRHTADGRAYSYNKVFDVNVAVGRDTRLSYRIFPSMADATATTTPRTSPWTWSSPTAPR